MGTWSAALSRRPLGSQLVQPIRLIKQGQKPWMLLSLHLQLLVQGPALQLLEMAALQGSDRPALPAWPGPTSGGGRIGGQVLKLALSLVDRLQGATDRAVKVT